MGIVTLTEISLQVFALGRTVYEERSTKYFLDQRHKEGGTLSFDLFTFSIS